VSDGELTGTRDDLSTCPYCDGMAFKAAWGFCSNAHPGKWFNLCHGCKVYSVWRVVDGEEQNLKPTADEQATADQFVADMGGLDNLSSWNDRARLRMNNHNNPLDAPIEDWFTWRRQQ